MRFSKAPFAVVLAAFLSLPFVSGCSYDDDHHHRDYDDHSLRRDYDHNDWHRDHDDHDHDHNRDHDHDHD